MYLFVYKTTHKNGKFYIGRHETNILEDKYLGSGSWVNSIKDKSTLSREILEFAKNIEELKKLEEHYIDMYWENPLCMNIIRGSDGWTSKDVSENNQKRLQSGTHNFQKRPDGTSFASDRVNNRTHNFQKRPDGTSTTSDKVKKGTHPFQRRPDGTSLASERAAKGTNPFCKRPDGTSYGADTTNKMLLEGTHPFQKRPDGTSLASDMVRNGTNAFIKKADGTSINSGLVPCVNKKGKYKKIKKEIYYNQKGEFKDWEWVLSISKEGMIRCNRNPSLRGNAKTFTIKNLETENEYTVIGNFVNFCKENNISKVKIRNPQKYPNYHWKIISINK